MTSAIRAFLLSVIFLASASASALAAPEATRSAPAPASYLPENAEKANEGVIGLISGGADGTYIRIAADLANVLDGEGLRILPIVGRGSLQNLSDIMFLRGIDVGIVQMDAREGLAATRLGEASLEKLRYIARLYNEEIHIIANREIADLSELAGKKVNIDNPGSGTNLTARLIFQKLGIEPEFTTFDQKSSYARLLSGEIQAAVYVAGRPVRAISEFPSEGRFHLLSVPFEGELAQSYLPARFSSADYPELIDGEANVDTLAVGNILAVFNWPRGSDRYKRSERFVNAFFSRFDEFLKDGRHPKWKEVNITAAVPGWTRFTPAQEWIDSAEAQATADAARDFDRFLTTSSTSAGLLSADDRERLFRSFLDWRQNRADAPEGARQ